MLNEGTHLDSFATSILGEIVQKGPQQIIYKVGIDSRTIERNIDGFAFIAIKGVHKNAHKFLSQVYRQGVRIFVVSEKIDFSKYPEATIIKVADGLEALQKFAAFHRKQFDIPVMAITGSNGKTIVKEWAYQLFYSDTHVLRSPNSYNSQVGVPLSVLLLNPSNEMGIFEAGISKVGEMQKLEKIIQPSIGIFTNIGPAHQENFSSTREKIDQKLALFANCKTLIYCKDQKDIAAAISDKIDPSITKSWSLNGPADLTIQILNQGKNDSTLRGTYCGVEREINLPFSHPAFIENACHLWLLMLVLNKSDDVITGRMQALSTIPMRLEQLEGIHGCVVINDVYNSDLNALGIGLDHLKSQSKNQKFTAIVSDIIGSGQHDKVLYQSIAKMVSDKGIDRFIGIGPKLMAHKNLFTDLNFQFFDSTKTFIDAFPTLAFDHENILVKGAREFRFEKIVDLLQEQTHETVLEIDLNRMADNLNFVRSKLNAQTKTMVMVKAFAYGSGSYDVARFLEYNGVDYLAVAYADEGISLRADGIKIPILVLNPELSSYGSMIRHNLEPQVYNFRTLEKFTEALQESDLAKTPFPIHIKINSGMNRLGFDLEEMDALANALSANELVQVVSAFTHLAGSDENEMDVFTKEQADQFLHATEILKDQLNSPFLRHILNSNGILRHPEYQLDMVRLGIALYGISTNKETQTNLQPVSSLKTSISQIRTVKSGDSIGYSPKSTEAKDLRIAILPIGYADGLPRLLGNRKGSVWINGKRCDFVGNMCMDMCMVDVSNVVCIEGDQAEIFGEQISIYEIAEWLQTIPYEVLTNISQRVKRVSIHS